MRTCFDIEEGDAYSAARQLLARRCRDWAIMHSRPFHARLVLAAMDSRHFSSDGRITHWNFQHIFYYLLEWVPRYVDADMRLLLQAPENLRTLLQFFRHTGLRDPRGGPLVANEEAIDTASHSMAKIITSMDSSQFDELWGCELGTRNMDTSNETVLKDLSDRLRRRYGRPSQGEFRTLPQLPVRLPSEPELNALAAEPLAVQRLTSLLEWVGKGRSIKRSGHLDAAASRDLARTLGVELTEPVRSSEDSDELRLYLLWAKKMGLVRRYRGRLVKVRKYEWIASDPVVLWQTAFDFLEELGDAICDPPQSPLTTIYPELIPDVLNSLYSLPEPMPLLRLNETVWLHSCAGFLNDTDEVVEQYERVKRHLSRMWALLVELDVVQIDRAYVDDMFRNDLERADESAPGMFDSQTNKWLLEEFTEPTLVVSLSPMAVAMLRQRMLEENREAGLVGELAGADAAEMLSVVSQHYPWQDQVEELSTWMITNHADVEVILDVARHTPFRSRAAAIVQLVYDLVPDAPRLLRGLRADPELAPSVIAFLVEAGVLEMLDLTDPERQLLTAESSLRLMEIEGIDSVVDGLEALTSSDAQGVIDGVLNSGHPDTVALDEFRDLVAEQLSRRRASRPKPPRIAPGRLGATRRSRVRRGGRP